MMSAFLGALEMLFTPGVLAALMVGTVGGMFIGAMPGFSAVMGVSLLLPITFSMDPAAGLVMLVALYTSAIYGGSITAILCSTPGTPASAATAIDGYPLTQRGRGMEAVGVATLASVFGGLVGAIALLTIAPQLGKLALKFSAIEYALVALFGLTVIGALAGENMMKGLCSAAIGILVGTIGADTLTGYPRLTFGSIYLEDGIQTAAAMIGLFSVSQVLTIAVNVYKGQTKIILGDGTDAKLKGMALPKGKELREIFPHCIRSSIIGTIIGIMPAAGSGVSSWVNYSVGKKFAKHPELYGNGSFEGIACSEAGNNAACGGALVPLITLGVPGSGVTAILLGGMTIHGLVPGAEMFTTYAKTTYTVMLGYFVANILFGVIGLLIAKYVAKVALVPMGYLGPIIIAVGTLGVYAIHSNFSEVVMMWAFGIVGYLMKKAGFSPSPMILGIVLSRIAEDNLRRAIMLSRGNMFTYIMGRPISLVFIALCIISLFSPIFMKWVNKKSRGK